MLKFLLLLQHINFSFNSYYKLLRKNGGKIMNFLIFFSKMYHENLI